MKRSTALLGVVLVAQIGAAFVLATRNPEHGYTAGTPMLAFDRASIDQIAVDDSAGTSVTLRKEGDEWIIPGLSDFAAEKTKVDALLGRLDDIKTGWPVATTSDAAKRFKVTDESHERRIVLSSSGKEAASILIGTSPAFQRVHARTAADTDIFSIDFSAYEAGARAEDWMDRSRLSIAEDKIARIKLPDVTIERKDGKFVVIGLAEGEKPKADGITKLVGAVTRPSFETVIGKGDEALKKVEPPEITVEIELADGKTVTRKYRKAAEGDAYLFGSSGESHVFRAAAASADPIVKGGRGALVEAAKKDEPAEPDGAKAPEAGKPEDAQAKPMTLPDANAPEGEKPAEGQAKPAETPSASTPEAAKPEETQAEPAEAPSANAPEAAKPEDAQAKPAEPPNASAPEIEKPEEAVVKPPEPETPSEQP